MGNKIDMTGRIYGKLQVISESNKPKKYETLWLCKCACGNFTEVRGYYLRSGHTKTCGHCPEQYDFFDNFTKCTVKSGRYFIFDNEDLDLLKQYQWSVDKHGYAQGINKSSGKKVKLHRLLLNVSDVAVVDHINGQPWDNRKCNLRFATQHQNTQNSAMPSSNTTGYKGVCFDKRKKKYLAAIHLNGKTKFLGYFSNPQDAAKAYDKAAVLYFGEFARLNFADLKSGREEETQWKNSGTSKTPTLKKQN